MTGRFLVHGSAILFGLFVVAVLLWVQRLPDGPSGTPQAPLQSVAPGEPGLHAVPFTQMTPSPKVAPSSNFVDFSGLNLPPPVGGRYEIRGGRGVMVPR